MVIIVMYGLPGDLPICYDICRRSMRFITVLTTTQPPYLHNLISVQRPREYSLFIRRYSCSATYNIILSIITDRSFRYASPCLWNHLLYLFVNLILVPVPPFPTHLFLHPSLLPILIHHSAHPLLPLSFTPGLKPTCFTNSTPVVSLLPFGLPSRTIAWAVSSELLGFCFLSSRNRRNMFSPALVFVCVCVCLCVCLWQW